MNRWRRDAREMCRGVYELPIEWNMFS